MLAEYASQLAYYASRIKELKISISTVNYQMPYTRLSGEALTRAKTMMRYEIDQFQLPTTLTTESPNDAVNTPKAICH